MKHIGLRCLRSRVQYQADWNRHKNSVHVTQYLRTCKRVWWHSWILHDQLFWKCNLNSYLWINVVKYVIAAMRMIAKPKGPPAHVTEPRVVWSPRLDCHLHCYNFAGSAQDAHALYLLHPRKLYDFECNSSADGMKFSLNISSYLFNFHHRRRASCITLGMPRS